MNRRDALMSLATSCATVAGAAVTAHAVQAPPGGLLAVLSVDDWLSAEQAERLLEHWRQGVEGTEFAKAKAVVLGKGMTLNFYDSNGKPVTVTAVTAEPA